MKTRIVASALVAFAASAVSIPAYAQYFSGSWEREMEKDRPGVKNAEEQAIEKEILALQAELKAAALAKDRAKVTSFYAPNYTMTHGGGMVDDAEGRINWVIERGGGFEIMNVSHQSIRVLSKDSAVSILTSPYDMRGVTGSIRYMIVYAKGDASQGYKGWRQVAALVNNIPDRRAAAATR